MPVVFIKKVRSHKQLRRIAKKEAAGHSNLEEKKEIVLRSKRNSTILFHVLLFTPILLFWLTIMASLERTPLTGR